MKRILILILILVLAGEISGQNSDTVPDSLANINLDFEILDSTAISSTEPLRNILFPNVVTYYSENGVNLAYYTTDSNKWITVPLPFSERTTDFDLVNLDNSGQPELIVHGVNQIYGNGGGTGVKGMIILNIDSIPTQIFKVDYGCFEESFGDRQNYGENRYFKEYERKIRVKANGIIISPLENNMNFLTECSLTKIPAGIYIMNEGKIRQH